MQILNWQQQEQRILKIEQAIPIHYAKLPSCTKKHTNTLNLTDLNNPHNTREIHIKKHKRIKSIIDTLSDSTTWSINENNISMHKITMKNVRINNNIIKLGTKLIKLYTNLYRYIELIFVLVKNLDTYIYND